MAMGKGFRVLEKISPPNPYSVLVEQRGKEDTLLLESQAVAVLSQQETESVKRQYTKVLDAYGCLGVLQINAGDRQVLFLVMVTGCVSIGKVGDSEVFRVTATTFVSLSGQQQDEERITEVRKLLNSGTFYFSWSSSGEPIDLSLCAQRKKNANQTDNRFFWNRMLHVHMMRFGVNCSQWLLKAMCGSVEIRTVYVGHRKASVAIISRLSCERAGTRFNVRGSNDDGYVANFVETEQVIYLDQEVTSFVQTRGSVPLFWEQPGVQVGSHKVKMSRGYEVSGPAFERHMDCMKERYGHQVIVNLLGSSLVGSKEGEAMLSQLFQAHHKASSLHREVPHLIFDYHQECRGGNTKNLNKMMNKMRRHFEAFGIFSSVGDEVHSIQRGTIRTNCLDCLDRTNCVQTFLGLENLTRQLTFLNLMEKQQMVSRFEEVFRQMWINNGNEVSKIYAGTGAIQGGSKLMDGARSAARTIQNNLLDNSKQEAIDILLVGSNLNSELADRARILLPQVMLHAPTPVLREMCKRYYEYASPTSLRVSVGTYNVNGGKHFRSVAYKDVSLADWLLDAIKISRSNSMVDLSHPDEPSDKSSDIFAIGFEEIVDLNASNIMAASSENAKLWAVELQKVLSRDNKFALVTYVQLVGVCLFLFIKPELAPYLRDVAVDSVKTGLGGATGNKGGVAIRLVLFNTSMCFVCAHFAAGQSQVNERNADYAEITRKIAFPMGRSLNSHDYVFWCGDFNYRIDMDKDEIKELVKKGDLQQILLNDQLKKSQAEGNCFKNYIEGDVDFPPTYKYDLFSDDFDTSEKARAPAWTDRVLWKRRKQIADDALIKDWNPGVLAYYGRAELKQSDHRPVIAIVDIEVLKVDENRRHQVLLDVLQQQGPPDATVVVRVEDVKDENEAVSLFTDEFMMELLQELSQVGEVILVRFVEETMWVTFREGECALAAANKGRLTLCGHRVQLCLKTPDWLQQAQLEMALCSNNTQPLCDLQPIAGLTEITDIQQDLEVPALAGLVDSPTEVDEAKSLAPIRPGAPPSRPPLPKSPQPSPQMTRKPMPKAGVISVNFKPPVPPSPSPAAAAPVEPEPPVAPETAQAPEPEEIPPQPVTPPQQAPLQPERIYEEIREPVEEKPPLVASRAPPPPPRLDSVEDVGPPPSMAPPLLPARPPQAATPPRGPPGPPIPSRPPPIPVRVGNVQFPTGAPPPIPARQPPRPS
ncbi:synaptojanin-1 [Neocloeon triangulifer]|uniref:synaptojanin-1 n=1 Tax=Neocloeon triangulifer TaxID=2078957 RepID=UPI00286EE62D|nr:synaptojanin-1 [Neocloeon triangulifer]